MVHGGGGGGGGSGCAGGCCPCSSGTYMLELHFVTCTVWWWWLWWLVGVLVRSVDVLVVVVVVTEVGLVGADKVKQKGGMDEVEFGPCTIGIVRQLCKGLGYCIGVDSC